MATIELRRTHTLPKDEAKRRAEAIAVGLKDKVELDWRWEGDRIVVAKGTRGMVSVSDTDVRVEIDLPFMLRVLKAKVESKVNEKLDLLR